MTSATSSAAHAGRAGSRLHRAESSGSIRTIWVMMPLGSEAKDSPAGERWNGIGLAMFVSTTSSAPSNERFVEPEMRAAAAGMAFD